MTFVNWNLVDNRRHQYSAHLHTNNTQNSTMKQDNRNGTYIKIKIHNITIRIHNLQNQTESYKTFVYTMMQNRTKIMGGKNEKRNSHTSNELHLIDISSNNDRRPVTKNFTLLHYTCRHFSSFHLKLHQTTLHSTSLHQSTLHFSHLNLTQLHFTTLSFGLAPFQFPTALSDICPVNTLPQLSVPSVQDQYVQ